jgi:hypothetical protein
MIKSRTIGLPNALVVIMDPTAGVVPRSMGNAAVASTDSCVVVGCLSEVDGETDITLGDMDQVDAGDHLLFTGEMKTPNRKIALLSCHNETLLDAATAHQVTSVRIWANDLAEPDRVIVGFR